jgi:hypothetical protein
MTVADDAIAATVERLGLTMRATVYTGSSWATVAKSDLKCSLQPLNQGISAAQTGQARSDLAARGVMAWERSYQMPTGARVAVDAYPGLRWNVQTATVWPEFGPGGDVINYRADVTRINA